MKTLRLLSLATVLAFVFAGCTGPKGDTGPAGANGNANVTSSLFNVAQTAWTYDNSLLNWYTQLPVSTLTPSFISSGGVVSVFFSSNSGVSWNALPYSEIVGANLTANWSVNMTSNSGGLVQVNYAYSDELQHNDPCTEYSANPLQFSVTCIAASVMKKHPNTNMNNYYEVQNLVKQEGASTQTAKQ